jgi:hypothetical protein
MRRRIAVHETRVQVFCPEQFQEGGLRIGARHDGGRFDAFAGFELHARRAIN